MKELQRIATVAPGDTIERAIHNSLRARLLAVVHQIIHELGDNDVAKFSIAQDLAFFRGVPA